MESSQSAILVLQDGRVFHGYSFGAPGETFGLLTITDTVFDYQTVLTEPKNQGQILVAISPHVGNTPWDKSADLPITVAGQVVRNRTRRTSDSNTDFVTQVEQQKLVGICEVDTRKLVRQLKDHPNQYGAISTQTLDPKILLEKLNHLIANQDSIEQDSEEGAK